MARAISTSLVLAFALCGASFATAAPPSAVDVPPQKNLWEAAIQLGQRYDTYYRQKDAVGIALLYARDGELVAPTGEVIRGHRALADYYRKRFASGAHHHRMLVDETHVIGDSGYSIWSYSVQAPVPGAVDFHLEEGHMAAVYAHDAGGWHFALVAPSVTQPKAGIIPLRDPAPARGS